MKFLGLFYIFPQILLVPIPPGSPGLSSVTYVHYGDLDLAILALVFMY